MKHEQVESLMLRIIHHLADRFPAKAILKGGMSLRMMDCPRLTNDLDYVFAPAHSKKELVKELVETLEELKGLQVSARINSRMIRCEVREINQPEVGVQVEVHVAECCPNQEASTASLASRHGEQPKIIRIARMDFSLANKLAAWNERRIARDLYDCFYLFTLMGITPDPDILNTRLGNVERRGEKAQPMTRETFLSEFRSALSALNDEALQQELGPTLSTVEFPGLSLRIRAGLNRLADTLEQQWRT